MSSDSYLKKEKITIRSVIQFCLWVYEFSEITDKFYSMVLGDPWMKVRELAETTGISTERVHFINLHYSGGEMSLIS